MSDKNVISFENVTIFGKESLAHGRSLEDLVEITADHLVNSKHFEKSAAGNIDLSKFERAEVVVTIKLVRPQDNVVSFAEHVAENPRNIQEAFDNAFAQAKGFAHVDEMLDSIPSDKRLPESYTRREQINHALAIVSGFDSVEDMLKNPDK